MFRQRTVGLKDLVKRLTFLQSNVHALAHVIPIVNGKAFIWLAGPNCDPNSLWSQRWRLYKTLTSVKRGDNISKAGLLAQGKYILSLCNSLAYSKVTKVFWKSGNNSMNLCLDKKMCFTSLNTCASGLTTRENEVYSKGFDSRKIAKLEAVFKFIQITQ